MLDSVATIIQYTIVLTGILLVLKYAYVTLFFVFRKNKIVQLNAGISNYKLRLKTKINQRFGSFKLYGESEIKSTVSETVKEILELQFADPADYEKLISGIAKINQSFGLENIISGAENVKKLSAESILAPEIATMRKAYEDVFNFDKEIALFTFEICQLTNQMVELVEDYNKLAKSEKRMKPYSELPKKIEIPAFFLLEDLCKRHKEEMFLMNSLRNERANEKESTIEKS